MILSEPMTPDEVAAETASGALITNAPIANAAPVRVVGDVLKEARERRERAQIAIMRHDTLAAAEELRSLKKLQTEYSRVFEEDYHDALEAGMEIDTDPFLMPRTSRAGRQLGPAAAGALQDTMGNSAVGIGRMWQAVDQQYMENLAMSEDGIDTDYYWKVRKGEAFVPKNSEKAEDFQRRMDIMGTQGKTREIIQTLTVPYDTQRVASMVNYGNSELGQYAGTLDGLAALQPKQEHLALARAEALRQGNGFLLAQLDSLDSSKVMSPFKAPNKKGKMQPLTMSEVDSIMGGNGRPEQLEAVRNQLVEKLGAMEDGPLKDNLKRALGARWTQVDMDEPLQPQTASAAGVTPSTLQRIIPQVLGKPATKADQIFADVMNRSPLGSRTNTELSEAELLAQRKTTGIGPVEWSRRMAGGVVDLATNSQLPRAAIDKLIGEEIPNLTKQLNSADPVDRPEIEAARDRVVRTAFKWINAHPEIKANLSMTQFQNLWDPNTGKMKGTTAATGSASPVGQEHYSFNGKTYPVIKHVGDIITIQDDTGQTKTIDLNAPPPTPAKGKSKNAK